MRCETAASNGQFAEGAEIFEMRRETFKMPCVGAGIFKKRCEMQASNIQDASLDVTFKMRCQIYASKIRDASWDEIFKTRRMRLRHHKQPHAGYMRLCGDQSHEG